MKRKYDPNREEYVYVEQDGTVLYDEENVLNRMKVSEESRDEIVKEITNINDEHAKKTCEKMFEILTGETVEEAKK